MDSIKNFSPKQCFYAGDAIIGCLDATKANEIISKPKSHIMRPIVMMLYFIFWAFMMAMVQVIVHDKVPGTEIFDRPFCPFTLLTALFRSSYNAAFG